MKLREVRMFEGVVVLVKYLKKSWYGEELILQRMRVWPMRLEGKKNGDREIIG